MPSCATSTSTSPSCSTACATTRATPYEWGEKALAHYERLRIDARTKRLVFSDALDFDEIVRAVPAVGRRRQCGFGIGTWLSNDLGLTPLNIVMKLKQVNNQPVAKISDDPARRSAKTRCSWLT